MDHILNRECTETINHVFKMNEKEVFANELKNLIEEVNKNGLQTSHELIVINFILYKLNEVDQHQDVAKELMTNYNKGKYSNKMFSQYCDETYFQNIKKYLIEVLIDYLIELDGITLEKITEILKKVRKKNQENFNEDSNIIKYIEGKINDKNKKLNTNSDAKIISSKSEKVVPASKSNIVNKINYELKIYYLGGANSCSQKCSIVLDSQLDYSTFLFYLKQKLGIYEHAKFKIIILNKNKDEVRFLECISQLNTKDVNELKIVPFDHIIEK
jgi:hypothetical protein